MSVLDRLRSAVIVPDKSPDASGVWAPPPSDRPGRWWAVLRDSESPAGRWMYCPHSYFKGRWRAFGEAEHTTVREVTCELAGVLGGSTTVWDRPGDPGVEPGRRLCRVCDVRVREVDPAALARPEVRGAIRAVAEAARSVVALGPQTVAGGRVRTPARDYDFIHATAGGVEFGVCWYLSRHWLSFPEGDTFRLVPAADAREDEARRTEWRNALSVLGQMAGAAAAVPPLLDDLVPPGRPAGGRGRPVMSRQLDAAAVAGVLDAYLSAVVHPILDPVVAGFQGVLDGIAGQGCPTAAENTRVVEMVYRVARQCGAEFYAEYEGELVRVGVSVKVIAGGGQPDARAQAPAASVFRVRRYDEQGGELKATHLAGFPPLIAARDLAHAQTVWLSRQPNG